MKKPIILNVSRLLGGCPSNYMLCQPIVWLMFLYLFSEIQNELVTFQINVFNCMYKRDHFLLEMQSLLSAIPVCSLYFFLLLGN